MLLHPDVVELRRFYSSPVGQVVRRDLASAIRRHWNNLDNVTLVGLGFAMPHLRPYLKKAACVQPVMFPRLGAMYWPADEGNHTVLAHEGELPVKDNDIDRVLVVHAAEHSNHLHTMMQEVFRILKPGGRALFIVPNRRGLWSARSNNPWGYGHPYHIAQLRHRAELAGLTYVQSSSALFYPPADWRGILRLSSLLEMLGRLFVPLQGGALLVEMEKQLYAGITEPAQTGFITPILSPKANTGTAREHYSTFIL